MSGIRCRGNKKLRREMMGNRKKGKELGRRDDEWHKFDLFLTGGMCEDHEGDNKRGN